MAELNEKLSESVRSRVLRDMRPSACVIYGKTGLSLVLGGALSLLVCGQFGVSVTHAAHHLSDRIHSHESGLLGLLLCGVVFSIISPFILRVFCSPIQFRYITRSSVHVALIWLVSLGVLLAHYGETVVDVAAFVLWTVAALVTFLGMARFLDWTLGHQRDFSPDFT